MNGSQFSVFEVVAKRSSTEISLGEFDDEYVVLGVSAEQGSETFYAVRPLNEPAAAVEMIAHKLLQSTGRFLDSKVIYDGVTLRVAIEPTSGTGKIVDPDEADR